MLTFKKSLRPSPSSIICHKYLFYEIHFLENIYNFYYLKYSKRFKLLNVKLFINL